MHNEMNLGNEVRGRVFALSVFGDSASGIEIAALAAGQAFFGEGVPLEVIPDYQAMTTTTLEREKTGGRKYVAYVTVRAT